VPDCDVLVIGAGPAGCGAARLLAAWGHRVIVVDRPADEARALAESIPPSARKVLGALGMLTAIEDAGFPPWQGTLVWWSPVTPDAEPRAESFPAGVTGYQVVRRVFDRTLRALAVESGATLVRGLARDVVVPGVGPAGPGRDTPHAVVAADGGTRTVSASFVLDCSGRAGVVARQGLRRAESSHHTVALVGVWRPHDDSAATRAAWPPGDTRTLVAAAADGWAWSVPTPAGTRYVTAMVDPKRTALARGRASREVYLEALAGIRPLQPLLRPATLERGPWGADAALYSADRFAGPGYLLVGDAGCFIDPLSSFGVKKALASGWLAAIVTHTALVRPALRDEALAFFERRERQVYASARAQAAAFAGEAAADSGHPFWLVRAGATDDPAFDDDVDAATLGRDREVVAAFEDLRRRPSVRFRTGTATRVGPRAAVRGREIVMDDHLFLPAWPGGVRYLRGVDLVSLVRLAPAHADVGDLIEAFAREHGPVALPDFLGALATLVAKGGLAYE